MREQDKHKETRPYNLEPQGENDHINDKRTAPYNARQGSQTSVADPRGLEIQQAERGGHAGEAAAAMTLIYRAAPGRPRRARRRVAAPSRPQRAGGRPARRTTSHARPLMASLQHKGSASPPDVACATPDLAGASSTSAH